MLLQNELSAAVLPIGRFIVAGLRRAVLTKADRIDARGINSKADQFFSQGQSSVFPQCAVVFFSTALIAMAFDFQGVQRMRFEVIGDGGHFRLFPVLDHGTIVIEVYRVRLEDFVVPGLILSEVEIRDSGRGDVAGGRFVPIFN